MNCTAHSGAPKSSRPIWTALETGEARQHLRILQRLLSWPADRSLDETVFVFRRIKKVWEVVEKLRGRVSLTLIGFSPWGETAAAGCRWLTGKAWRLSSEWSRRAGRGWRPVERFLFVGLKSEATGLRSGLDVRRRVDKELDEVLSLVFCRQVQLHH